MGVCDRRPDGFCNGGYSATRQPVRHAGRMLLLVGVLLLCVLSLLAGLLLLRDYYRDHRPQRGR